LLALRDLVAGAAAAAAICTGTHPPKGPASEILLALEGYQERKVLEYLLAALLHLTMQTPSIPATDPVQAWSAATFAVKGW
jgi:hypothetical protein